MATAHKNPDYDGKPSEESNGSQNSGLKNKNQKGRRTKYNQNRKGSRGAGGCGDGPHLPERVGEKMPEPREDTNGHSNNSHTSSLNTPPRAKIEKLDVGSDPDTTAENFFSANNTTLSFGGNGEGSSSSGNSNERDEQNGNSVSSPSSKDTTKTAEDAPEDEEEEADENVTHASLIVNISDSAANFNFQSFTTPNTSSLSASPLSSSRSAPPDLASVEDFSQEDFPKLTGGVVKPRVIPFQTSTPLISLDTVGTSSRLDTVVEGAGAAAFEPFKEDLATTPVTTKPKKKNSVSFAETENIIIPNRDPQPYDDDESGEEENEAPSTSSAASTSMLESGNTSYPFQAQVQAMLDDKLNSFLENMGLEDQAGGSGDGTRSLDASLDSYSSALGDSEADEEVEEINKASSLPTTVTELIAPNGVKVYVVGTAHFSKQSHLDVIETIQKVVPSLVVLELCHARRNILTLNEETILKEAAELNFDKVRAAIRQSGAVRGGLHLLLLSMSASLTKQLGMAPGGEFRVAVTEAQKIPGCMLLLGDRAFDVTLARALNSLTFAQKVKMGWQFLTTSDKITKEEIEACKEKDLLEKMLSDMTGEFPTISRVFVDERDLYLAHSLWLAATSTRGSAFGLQNSGPIVGVVGMGHVAGIVKNWGKVTEEQIAAVVKIPEPTLTSIVVGKTLKFSFYLLLGYGAYKCSRRLFNFPSDHLIETAVGKVMPPIQNLSDRLLSSKRL